MSYDIDLKYGDRLAEVKHFEEGGTCCLGGIDEAHLNITYNYWWFFRRFIDKEKGIRWIYGKKARDTIKVLEQAIEELGTQQFENYWAPTPGNAGYALSILLRWAKQHPEAEWSGD